MENKAILNHRAGGILSFWIFSWLSPSSQSSFGQDPWRIVSQLFNSRCWSRNTGSAEKKGVSRRSQKQGVLVSNGLQQRTQYWSGTFHKYRLSFFWRYSYRDHPLLVHMAKQACSELECQKGTNMNKRSIIRVGDAGCLASYGLIIQLRLPGHPMPKEIAPYTHACPL